MLALEIGSLVLTLVLRPHISRIVTACEVVCSCLHVASTAMLLAAHRIAHGDVASADSVMQVGSALAFLCARMLAMLGILQALRLPVGFSHAPCYQLQAPAPHSLLILCARAAHTQRLDATCAAVAQAGLAVQLAAVLWRLLGQLLALEGLVFLLFKPRWLTALHTRLVGAAVWISGALDRAGAGGQVLDEGARVQLWLCMRWVTACQHAGDHTAAA